LFRPALVQDQVAEVHSFYSPFPDHCSRLPRLFFNELLFPGPMPIPNDFHFVFGLKRQTEPFHLVYYLCLRSCIETHQPDNIFFYYRHKPHGRYWDLIANQLTLRKVDLVDHVSRFTYKNRQVKKYNYAHHADFIRLEKLYEQGGVYADMDTLFVDRIPETLYSKPFVIGREDEVAGPDGKLRASLCNAFLMAEKGSLFAADWLSEMSGAFDGTWSNHSTILPDKLSREHPDWVHIEPQRTFYKHMWTPEGINRLFVEVDTDTTGVVSFHLWNHLWWSRWRRDFTKFHAGKMTEKNIRTVDTTYNLIARKYLP